MTGRLLLVHAALALAAGVLSALVRPRGARAANAVHDALVALLLPVVGPAIVLSGVVLELAFRRRSPAATAEEPAAGDDGRREPDPVEELRIGTTVAPVAEVLAVGTLEEVDRALRRLARSDDPATLLLIRDALQAARLDVRVRARGLVVRIEDRLLACVRESRDPLERARARRKLACLSGDPVSLQQHLRAAVTDYEQALAGGGSTAGGEFGRLLLLMGDVERARRMLTSHLRRHPDDSAARLARAQASLRAADLRAAREDCPTLGLPAPE